MIPTLAASLLRTALVVLFCAVGVRALAEPPPDQGPPSVEQDARININSAGVSELVALPGIGPSRAEAIIAEREKRPFRRVEDVMRVPGIGRKTYLRIRASIRVR